MRKRPQTYWEKRSVERLTDAEKRSIPYFRRVQRIYRRAAVSTTKDLKAMYATYYRKDKTFDMQALNEIAPQGDIKRFRALMEAKGLSTYLPDNYNGRITRLELLNAQLRAKASQAASEEKNATSGLYKGIFRDTYYRTGYDTAKGLNENLSFSALDTSTVDKILDTKFKGANYSERIWANRDKLAKQLGDILAESIATGASVEKTARLINERFDVGASNALRLVRTETNYFENLAEIEAYREMGIKKFQFCATMDGRTSEICAHMDGQVFDVRKAMSGENLPPLHANCRSGIAPYLGKEFEPKTRIARDPKTGENYYIDNMTYKEWKQTLKKQTIKKQVENVVKSGVAGASVALGGGGGEPVKLNKENENKVGEGVEESDAVILTSEEERAVTDYISSFSYILNDRMRNNYELESDEIEFIKNFDNVLRKLKDYKGDVIRDLHFYNSDMKDEFISKFIEGGIYQNDKNYWSATTNENGHNPSANVRLFIKSKTGKDFRKYNPDEGEIIFMRGSKFLVEKIDESERKCVKIYLKEVNGE